jgi:two-component system cell cycle response regulator DivK
MSKKVLVVDDEADLRKMMKILLGMHGFQVIEAQDGYEALEKAVAETPDLILMDMAMPVLGGLESTRAIRHHKSLDDVPILAVTAYGDFYADRAREAGCTEVIRKPLDFAQLKPLVDRYIH